MSLEYVLQETSSRIVALDTEGHELAGAYTTGASFWQVYVASPVVDLIDADHHFPSHLLASRQNAARQWVDLIVKLYLSTK